MSQTSENGKKPNFGPNYGPLDPNLDLQTFFMGLPLPDVRHCCKLSLYVISRKTNEWNLRKWQKHLIKGPDFGSFSPNLCLHFFNGFYHY